MISSFCTGCGAALAGPALFCPSCGRPVHLLGQGLVQSPAAPPSAPAPPRIERVLPVVAVLAAVAVVTALLVVVRVSLRPTEPVSATGHSSNAPGIGGTTAPTSPAPSSPAPSTSPSSSTKQWSQEEVLSTAGRVDALLDESAGARAAVIAATSGLSSCRLPAFEAAGSLQAVAQTRSRLLDELAMIRFDPLPHGTRLAALLGQAWSSSLAADEAYLRWAQSRSYDGGCDTTDADYATGNAASERAVSAKRAFVALWNSEVAAPLHLARRDDGHL